jgi:hypothetical protein
MAMNEMMQQIKTFIYEAHTEEKFLGGNAWEFKTCAALSVDNQIWNHLVSIGIGSNKKDPRKMRLKICSEISLSVSQRNKWSF